VSQGPSVTPQAAILRVLFAGESDGPEIARKIRDWTDGRMDMNDVDLIAALNELEANGMVERRFGPGDKRSPQTRPTFALTAQGHASAMEILAESLTRKGS
jgi:DNA-binding PadR family transcriptional regulator